MAHEETITTAKHELELREVRRAVATIINDYKQTAETLDEVTKQVDGMNATDHASNVESLKQDLLSDLGGDSMKPPWEREGYDSKQAWLDAQE